MAFYWVVLILFLQRGRIAPLSEEVTDPDDKWDPSFALRISSVLTVPISKTHANILVRTISHLEKREQLVFGRL